jgi:tetratricopeptide (TPR) repeat protein
MKTLSLIVFFSAVFLSGFVNAQTGEIFYYPKLIKSDANSAKSKLAGLIDLTRWGKPVDVAVFDDRMEFSFKGKKKSITKESIFFAETAGDPVCVIRSELITPAKKPNCAGFGYYNFTVRVKGPSNLFARDVFDYFYCKDDKPAPASSFNPTYSKQNVPETEANYKRLADYFYFFQHPFIVKHYDSLLVQFKPVAEQYRTLNVKPAISEEQRKYIVQANAMNQNKDYYKAIELYNKALEVDQTAYPGAYSNLALLSAQIQNYEGAIFYMKKYLLLEPEPAEVRSAQDKIYEWEALTAR